jgi:hypothetical protein
MPPPHIGLPKLIYPVESANAASDQRYAGKKHDPPRKSDNGLFGTGCLEDKEESECERDQDGLMRPAFSAVCISITNRFLMPALQLRPSEEDPSVCDYKF